MLSLDPTLVASDDSEQSDREEDSGVHYLPGDVVGGKYRLVRLLSQGGMGSVWVAYNDALHAQVALKLIRSENCSPKLIQRFLTEARLAARLEHRAIVKVYDVSTTECDRPYLIMELLHGEDLRTVLMRTVSLPAVQAVQILLPIAEALDVAHRAGVIHRDLKPENIFLSQVGEWIQPKIVDFGIARPTHEETSGRRLTDSGAVVGSPDYMSPEQARAEDVDERSDIWSLCAVLYECLCGCLPFSGGSPAAIMRAIIDCPLRPAPLIEREEPALFHIIQRGLAKDKRARWKSVRELGQALVEWLVSRGITEDISGQSLHATWFRRAESHATRLTPATGRSSQARSPVFGPFGSRRALRSLRADMSGRFALYIALPSLAVITGALAAGATGWRDSDQALEQARVSAEPSPSAERAAEQASDAESSPRKLDEPEKPAGDDGAALAASGETKSDELNRQQAKAANSEPRKAPPSSKLQKDENDRQTLRWQRYDKTLGF